MSLELRTLGQLADDAGFTAADVAYLADLHESTVSRLWDDPGWLDRVRGNSLQAFIRVIPGIAEYFAEHSLSARRVNIVGQLAEVGLTVDETVYRRLVVDGQVAEQHLGSALEAGLHIVRRNVTAAASHLARFWGLSQDHALACLFAPPDRDGLLPDGRGLLLDPEPLVQAATRVMGDLGKRANSFHATLAYACLAHHLARVTGASPVTRSADGRPFTRHTALAYRSIVMGLIVETNDVDLALRWTNEVARDRALARMEHWALPGQTHDIVVAPSFYLPGRLPLSRTAPEVLYQIETYNDAYFTYLVSTAIPNMLTRDPTFGFQDRQLYKALKLRLDAVTASPAHKPAQVLLTTLRGQV